MVESQKRIESISPSKFVSLTEGVVVESQKRIESSSKEG